MINKEKIVFNTKTYYTPTFGNPVGVVILKLFDDNCVLIKSSKGTFVRPVKHMYNTVEDARKGTKDWEHDDKKIRKKKK